MFKWDNDLEIKGSTKPKSKFALVTGISTKDLIFFVFCSIVVFVSFILPEFRQVENLPVWLIFGALFLIALAVTR